MISMFESVKHARRLLKRKHTVSSSHSKISSILNALGSSCDQNSYKQLTVSPGHKWLLALLFWAFIEVHKRAAEYNLKAVQAFVLTWPQLRLFLQFIVNLSTTYVSG